MQPLIGVTTAVRVLSTNGITVCTAYTAILSAVERAGGLPVMIPSNMGDDTLRAIYARLDGVLLPGGGDIDPKYFDEAPHPALDMLDPLRDNAEVKLVRWAAADEVPLFGICRGHQVIHVALGGSLIQDIPSQVTVATPEQHALPEGAARSHPSHAIQVADNTRLAGILGNTQLIVNSIHHQAVKTPAPGFVITATSPDGLIEASEMPGKRFALTVQWHPEDLAPDDPHMQGLFDAFVQASAERMER
ncbi:MAG: gamma-glutamyl-gamma-aminobutyrate hydrolase family protein [Armatimonadetes bacterium]|nr:gamma-glutamyl-gamma-aminobutyrate hydrolase family protein [Anaerolineae bacterium]